MAQQLLPYALTTEARVKTRLSITAAGFDALIQSLVNAVTDFIEGQCNRRFKETAYANEAYTIPIEGSKYVVLKQAPAASVTSAQYRAGVKSSPSWTDFNADDWELLEDGASGIVQIHGNVPKGTNNIRFSYTAGYKINFTNFGDNSTHTLPADLSDLAERLVVKMFKRREAEGKSQESFEGGSVTWESLLNETDREIINRHKRFTQFF